jgi:hypothetical protein
MIWSGLYSGFGIIEELKNEKFLAEVEEIWFGAKY